MNYNSLSNNASLLPSEWELIRFEDANLEIEDGDRGKNYPKKNEFFKSGYCPFLNNKNITGDKISFTEVDFISEEKDKLLRKGKIKPNDLILTTRGTVGNVGLFKGDGPYKFGRINSGMVIIRNNENLFDLNYLYQLLKSPNLKAQYKNLSSGSAQPQLPIRDIKKLKLTVPPLHEQKSISNLLSSLDNKIEMNNEMQKTLDEMAEAIFIRWFVDFEFPNEDGSPYKSSGGKFLNSEIGSVPEGWKVKYLNEFVNSISKSINNKEKKQAIFLNTSDILEGQFLHESFSNVENMPGQAKKLIQENDILYSEIRPANKRFAYVDFDAKDYVVSTKLMVLRTNENIFSSKCLYLYLKSSQVIRELQSLAESRSGTFPQITFKEISGFRLALPDKNLFKKNYEILESLIDHQNNLIRENKKVIALRDLLLPKLMSGEIRIPAVEQEVKACLQKSS